MSMNQSNNQIIKKNLLIICRGAGDLATGIIHRLHRAGHRVIALETDYPAAIRRQVSFCEAVYDGSAAVEGVTARLVPALADAETDTETCSGINDTPAAHIVSEKWDSSAIEAVLEAGEVPLLIDPKGESIALLKPDVVVDAIIAKKNLGTTIDMAPLVIGVGPGFTAGQDVHLVIESMRGHNLARIITDGMAQPNTGVPGNIAGFTSERVIHAPARLISGILAGQSFTSELNGDASIQSRPMKRIMTPLLSMGADIVSLRGNGCTPLRITGKSLHAAHYQSPVASAQVKSCVLLAGMYADGITSVTEPVLSRNHTEIMLNYFGANVTSQGTTASIEPEPVLNGREIKVPGDISSAAYFIAAGLLTPGSEILLKNVGINPTRDGMLRVCKAMGADITLLNASTEGEPTADLLIRTSSLHGTTVEGEIIPTLIDEIPMIAVMAAFAERTTVIRDAQELKVKESDRIAVVTEGLKRMGADIQPTDDGMIIHGGKPLHGAEINSYLDHRIAMSFAVAGTICDGTLTIKDGDCVKISYPEFYEDLYSLGK